MVFIEIRSVVVLSSGHTTSTRMLTVLANTSVAGGDMTAAENEVSLYTAHDGKAPITNGPDTENAYSLRVFVDRVGILLVSNGELTTLISNHQ